MTERLRRKTAAVLGVGVATFLLALAAIRLDWTSVGAALARFNPFWLLVAILCNVGLVFLWSTQWRALLPRGSRVSVTGMFEIVAIMAMVANTIPYMVGQGTGVFLLSTRGKIGHAAAVSVLALEQLAEGVAKLSLVLLVAAILPLPDWLAGGMVGLSGFVLVLIIAFLFAIGWRRYTPSSDLEQASVRWPKLQHFVEKLARHLEAVRDIRVFGLGLVCTFGMKFAEALGIAAVQHAFGLDVTVGGVLLVLVATNLATMISLVPGNLGVYEGAAYLAYSYLGLPPEQGVGLGIVHHACMLFAMVGTGYLVVVTRSVNLRGLLSRNAKEY